MDMYFVFYGLHDTTLRLRNRSLKIDFFCEITHRNFTLTIENKVIWLSFTADYCDCKIKLIKADARASCHLNDVYDSVVSDTVCEPVGRIVD